MMLVEPCDVNRTKHLEVDTREMSVLPYHLKESIVRKSGFTLRVSNKYLRGNRLRLSTIMSARTWDSTSIIFRDVSALKFRALETLSSFTMKVIRGGLPLFVVIHTKLFLLLSSVILSMKEAVV